MTSAVIFENSPNINLFWSPSPVSSCAIGAIVSLVASQTRFMNPSFSPSSFEWRGAVWVVGSWSRIFLLTSRSPVGTSCWGVMMNPLLSRSLPCCCWFMLQTLPRLVLVLVFYLVPRSWLGQPCCFLLKLGLQCVIDVWRDGRHHRHHCFASRRRIVLGD